MLSPEHCGAADKSLDSLWKNKQASKSAVFVCLYQEKINWMNSYDRRGREDEAA